MPSLLCEHFYAEAGTIGLSHRNGPLGVHKQASSTDVRLLCSALFPIGGVRAALARSLQHMR